MWEEKEILELEEPVKDNSISYSLGIICFANVLTDLSRLAGVWLSEDLQVYEILPPAPNKSSCIDLAVVFDEAKLGIISDW